MTHVGGFLNTGDDRLGVFMAPGAMSPSNVLPLSRERRQPIVSAQLRSYAPLVGCSGMLGVHATTPRMNLGLRWQRGDLAEDMIAKHLSLPRQIQRNRQAPPVFNEHFHSLRLLPSRWRNANVFADCDCPQFVLARFCPKGKVQSRQDLDRRHLRIEIIWSRHH